MSVSAVDPHWVRGPADRSAAEQGCYFDEGAGQFVCDFIERFCRQSKGRWKGQPLTLLPWQRDFLMRLFGWKRPGGLRRFRRAYLEVGKKNGKSTLISALVLVLLLADGEGAPEVHLNACDRDQASIVYEEAARMVEACPDLARRLQVLRSRKLIVDPVGYGRVQANSGKVETKDGLNPSGVIFDELHRQPGRDLWDVFEFADVSRDQPLTISITTAGEDESGVWFEQREYSEAVGDGRIPDTTHLGVVYRARPEDDLDSPETWKKANPSLGVTIQEDRFRRDLEEAKRVPVKLANFKRLRLNIIARTSALFVTPEQWSACAAPPLDLETVRGEPCWMGLDLSSTDDLSALAALFGNEADGFDLVLKFWLPEEDIAHLERRNQAPYRLWADQGYITLTPGPVIDYGFIRRTVNDLAAGVDLRKLLVDPYNATKLALELKEQDGLPVEFVRQGFLSLSPAAKELRRLIQSRKLRHGNHPVLRWMAGHAACTEDEAGNLKLSKKKSRHKIDGLSAAVNAVAGMSGDPPAAGGSVYDERGLEFL